MQRTRFVLCVFVLCLLATSPAWPQTHDQNARMILSHLPLNNAEMWSVPYDRVAIVKATAARFGVIVNEFAADWNHLFRPMPAHPSLTVKHKGTMRSAISGMMLPPRAAMVEYAL